MLCDWYVHVLGRTGNNIGAAGMASFAPALCTLHMLTYLDLSRKFGFRCMVHDLCGPHWGNVGGLVVPT